MAENSNSVSPLLNCRARRTLISGLTLAVFLIVMAPALEGYSVLSHEAVVDTAWDPVIKPILLKLYPTASEDQLREAVVKSAKDDGIELNRDQVTVEKTVTLRESTVHLAVDYDGKIDLFVITINPHFSLSSSGTMYLPAQ